MRRKEKGFSLLELLIVLAIIAVVSALAVPNMVKAAQVQAQAGAKQRVRSMYGLVEQAIFCQQTQTSCAATLAMVPPNGTAIQAGAYSYVFAGINGDGTWSYTATPVPGGPASGMAVIQTTNQGGLTCNGASC